MHPQVSNTGQQAKMVMFTDTRIAIVASAVFFLVAASCASAAAAGQFCTKFSITEQFVCWASVCDYFPYSKYNRVPYVYRVSPMVMCIPGNPQYPRGCTAPEQAGLQITQPGLVNISTLVGDETAALFGLIEQEFNQSTHYSLANTSFPFSATVTTKDGDGYGAFVPNDMRGFLAKYPSLICVEGVLSGCGPGCTSVVDQTPIRACAPVVDSPGGDLTLYGINVVITNDTAYKMGTGPVPTPAKPIQMVPKTTAHQSLYHTLYSTIPAFVNTTSVPPYIHPPYPTPTTVTSPGH